MGRHLYAWRHGAGPLQAARRTLRCWIRSAGIANSKSTSFTSSLAIAEQINVSASLRRAGSPCDARSFNIAERSAMMPSAIAATSSLVNAGPELMPASLSSVNRICLVVSSIASLTMSSSSPPSRRTCDFRRAFSLSSLASSWSASPDPPRRSRSWSPISLMMRSRTSGSVHTRAQWCRACRRECP